MAEVEAQPFCDEHPKKLTVAQAATSTLSGPSEVRSHLRQHLTLEISPFNHNNHLLVDTAGIVCELACSLVVDALGGCELLL